MYRIKGKKKRDAISRWALPDRVFFACGACHILAFAFLARYRPPSARAIWLAADHAGRLLGVCGYHAIDWNGRLFSAGYWVRTSETGKGLATEMLNALTRYAFKALAANRVAISHAIGNDASRRVIEKCGFALEGTTHKFYVLNGFLVDSRHYASFGCERLPAMTLSCG